MNYPFIKNIVLPDSAVEGEVTITVLAEWPTPLWSIDQISSSIDNNLIVVECKGVKRDGMTMMVIVPFSFEVSLKLKTGVYKIIVKGRAGDKEATLEVK